MNRKLSLGIILLLVIFAVLWLLVLPKKAGNGLSFSCVNPAEPGLETTTYMKKGGNYVYQPDHPYIAINVELPELHSPQVTADILEFVADRICEFQYDNALVDMPDDELMYMGITDDAGNLTGRTFDFHARIESYQDGPLHSYLLNLYTYTGGAHGTPVMWGFAYDDQDRKLDIIDVFGEEGFDEFAGLVREDLYRLLGPDADTSMIDFGTEPLHENFTVFYFDDNAITVGFDVYQVAPYSVGQPRVTFRIDEVAHLLTDEFAAMVGVDNTNFLEMQ